MDVFAAGENAELVTMPTSFASSAALAAGCADCVSVARARRRVNGAGGSAFDDFLAGVAAFAETDVRRLQRSFVRNHGVVEIVRKPRNPGFQAQGIQRAHSNRGAVLRQGAGAQILPQQSEMRARRDYFRARQTTMRV